MKGISLQKTYLSITDNCTQSSGDTNTRKNNVHDLDICSGQKANLSLTDKQQDSAVETKYFVFRKLRHNIFCGVFYEKVELKNMYLIKFVIAPSKGPHKPS